MERLRKGLQRLNASPAFWIVVIVGSFAAGYLLAGVVVWLLVSPLAQAVRHDA